MITSSKIFLNTIRAIRRANNLTQKQLGEKLGVSFQSVQQWESGRSKPSLENLRALSEVFNVPMDDLASVNAVESQSHEVLASFGGGGKRLGSMARVARDRLIELPFVSIHSRTNFIECRGDISYIEESHSVISRAGEDLRGQIVVEIDGDSMEPYYDRGILVRAKLVPRTKWPLQNSGVYVVMYDDYLVVKRIKGNDFEKGFIILHSDNHEKGGPISVPIESIRAIWSVQRIVDGPIR